MNDEVDRLDGLDLVGMAERIQKVMADRDKNSDYLDNFNLQTQKRLAMEIRRATKGQLTATEVAKITSLCLDPTLLEPKDGYWFEETLDKTVEREKLKGVRPSDGIDWTPHVTIGCKRDDEDRPAESGCAGINKDTRSANPEALFYAIIETAVEDYKLLKAAGLIVNGQSIPYEAWPRDRTGNNKFFCGSGGYDNPVAVNELICYLRNGDMDADLQELGSNISASSILDKIGLSRDGGHESLTTIGARKEPAA